MQTLYYPANYIPSGFQHFHSELIDMRYFALPLISVFSHILSVWTSYKAYNKLSIPQQHLGVPRPRNNICTKRSPCSQEQSANCGFLTFYYSPYSSQTCYVACHIFGRKAALVGEYFTSWAKPVKHKDRLAHIIQCQPISHAKYTKKALKKETEMEEKKKVLSSFPLGFVLFFCFCFFTSVSICPSVLVSFSLPPPPPTLQV